ncbi:MAG: histidine kinase [Pedosphaera sp.]|nr:histidine kinase [Pedosphaera sp.]
MVEPIEPETSSTAIYRMLVEQVRDYAIFMLDNTGHVMTWNEGARRFKGYEAREIIGKHFSIFYPKQDLDHDKPARELKLAVELGRYEDEGWRVRKDGTRFWANVIITPLRDAAGKLSGFAKVTRDLTQRKLQEESIQHLLESEERFRLLVEQVKDYAIFILDAKGTINSWNQGARRIKGYTSDEILGKHFSIFYTPEDLAADKPARELTFAIREGRYEEEGWRVRKDGTRFWASVVITTLWDKRGNLTGFAKVTRDLTQRKMEEEALRQKTRDLQSFAHTISHDLRSPLRSIRMSSDLITSQGTENLTADQQAYFARICRSAQTMEKLLEGILQYSQVSTNELESGSISLQDVVKQVVDLLESEIQRTGAHVQITSPLPPVKGNRTLLIQTFSNLLGNAIKYVPEGRKPEIRLWAETKDNEVDIYLRDNGIGIEERYFQRIFNLFERVPTGSSGAAGTGVGLAIVQRAIERMGGKVEVQSSVLNEGTTFLISLPVPGQ